MRTIVKKSEAAKKRATPAGGSKAPIESPDGMWQRISRKAYELWEQRGRQDGNDLRNWLDAEEIVMGETHEVRE